MEMEEPLVDPPADDEEETTPLRATLNFWLVGVLNNASYVIMIASAKAISNGGVALVYIAGIAPGSMTKASSPFWFDATSYAARLATAAVLMAGSFLLAGPLSFGALVPQLIGVGLCSAQSALGEASLLALASRFPKRGARAVAAWSSGTGFAGVFGYAWVVGLQAVGLNEASTQAVAFLVLPPAFAVASFALLRQASNKPAAAEQQTRPVAVNMTAAERVAYATSLWPVTGPIFAVYFAEYAMQSGVFPSIGFPVTSREKRDDFYELANWLYQCGVLTSRSPGFFVHGAVRKPALWAMSLAQCFLLVFFSLDAVRHWWYDNSILALCFVVGLFGGAVYVHGFRLLAATSHPRCSELAMPIGAFAADAGTLLSNVVGLFLQSCLYQRNHIHGAIIRMPSSVCGH